MLLLIQPPQQPWYANYHFRFEGVRSNGDRVTYTTKIPALSKADAEAKIRDLLGSPRYEITFVGCEIIPVAEWPLQYKLACGLDKRGNPVPPPAPPANASGPKPKASTRNAPSANSGGR